MKGYMTQRDKEKTIQRQQNKEKQLRRRYDPKDEEEATRPVFFMQEKSH